MFWFDEVEFVDGCCNWVEVSVDKVLRIVILGEYFVIVNRGCGYCFV